MSQIRNIRLLLSLVCIILLASCQNEFENPAGTQQQYTMELVPLSTPFVDVQRMGTRADYENHLPVGYISYNELYPTTTPPNKTIGVFMTPERESSLGDFIYQGIEDGLSIWKSTVTVVEGHQYYIYGFMPHGDADRAVISPLPTANTSGIDKGYAEGAVLTPYEPICGRSFLMPMSSWLFTIRTSPCSVTSVRDNTRSTKSE